MNDTQQQELQQIVEAILTNDDHNVPEIHHVIKKSVTSIYEGMYIDAIGLLKKSGFTDNQLQHMIVHISKQQGRCDWIIGYFDEACKEAGKTPETNDGATH